MNFGKFRVIQRPRTPLWKRLPDKFWEAFGGLLIKLIGETIKGKVARLIIISLIAAATGAEVEDSQK